MNAAQQLRLQDGTTLSYVVRGSGRPVYVCHGGPSTTYRYLMEDLEPLVGDAQLVFHDYRGSGLSGIAPRGSYTFEQLADDLDELRRHLGHDKIALLAHSMGGFVALTFALRHPDRCDRAVVIGASPTGRVSKLALRVVRYLGITRVLRVKALFLWYVLWWSWRRPTVARTRARYAVLAVMYEGKREFRARIHRRGERDVVENDNAPTLERRVMALDLTKGLSTMSAPLLVIVGGRDAFSRAGTSVLSRAMPSATVRILHGVGHQPLVEAADESLELIRDFLLP